jgi:hypothetical protein
MLKKSAGSVLASLKGSTYRSVRLAFSLAAALLDGLFEHPARYKVFHSLLCSQYFTIQLFHVRDGRIETKSFVRTRPPTEAHLLSPDSILQEGHDGCGQ